MTSAAWSGVEEQLVHEEEPRPKPSPGLPRPLGNLDVSDLEAYRSALEREIGRVDAELQLRRSVRGAAEALFRPRTEDSR